MCYLIKTTLNFGRGPPCGSEQKAEHTRATPRCSSSSSSCPSDAGRPAERTGVCGRGDHVVVLRTHTHTHRTDLLSRCPAAPPFAARRPTPGAVSLMFDDHKNNCFYLIITHCLVIICNVSLSWSNIFMGF